ncbi:MAG: class I SAM-dependent methyltransferase [Planctomycetaceae bacterium]|jgi:16S rRNA (guanine527-N7)-methyltransferase|nr:class I SAM-dependent methyltransferase [Planctomycetaceae bacterium]
MESLQESLKRYNISLTKDQIKQLDSYCQLLWDWNSRLNLTRHITYERFVARDLVDAMAIAEFLRNKERILDVGSGGGMPGIILKILRPDLHVELCDSTGKKTLALSEIVNELYLDIPVHHAKAETLLAASAAPKNKKFTKQTKYQKTTQEPKNENTRFTTLTIRAVAKLTQLLRMFSPYWTLFDRLILVKGPNWISERGEARHYNLMNKLALRVLKNYPTNIEQTQTELTQITTQTETQTKNQTENQTKNEHGNSVVLQICRKDDFEQLDKIIDNHIKSLIESRRPQNTKNNFKKINRSRKF